MPGIYVHIPFCSSFCIYCDFYSVTECSKRDIYIEALERETVRRKYELKGAPTTIYIGGGTPSLLSIEQLSRVVEILSTHFSFDKLEEFTIEVNPDDISPDYAAALKGLGVTRVSMGIQSFNDENLRWMRRRHTSEESIAAYRTLRDAGFGNISLDLIFGYKASDMSDEEAFLRWKQDIKEMIKLRPEHISAYQMSIEPGSMLALSGNYSEPSQEFCEKCYWWLIDELRGSGYEQYEISNFSLPGYNSRHNSSYWERSPYLGLGAAAHSFDGAVRRWNPDDLSKYIAGAAAGWGEGSFEVLSEKEALEEKIMLGLRRARGVTLSEQEHALLSPSIEALTSKGLLLYDPESYHISLPRESLFISDSVISELF